MKKNKTFDVVIKSYAGKIVSVTGQSMTAADADRRYMTALSRINPNGYFVEILPHNPKRKAVQS